MTSALVNLTALHAHEAADEARRAQGDQILSTIAEPLGGGGVTLHLPDGFTAGEVNEVLREWAATFVRTFLLAEDRMAWALAGLHNRTGGPTSEDEADARTLVALVATEDL